MGIFDSFDKNESSSQFEPRHSLSSRYRWIDSLAGGRYRFVEPLSLNACVARDADGRLVVIKNASIPGPDGCPTYDNPLTEVKIHSAISHPNIIKLVRWHEEEQHWRFIVTEWVNGDSLARRFFLRPGEQKEVLPLLIQITSAVAYLHDSDIIHRDLTPQNVIVSGDKAYVIDFGAADYFSPNKPPRIFAMTVMIGPAEVYHPDWIRPPDELCFPSSDVFHLAMLGVFMLTGCFLKSHGSLYTLRFDKMEMELEVNQALDCLQAANPSVSSGLVDVLRKASSIDHNMRYETAGDMLVALKTIPGG